MDFCDQDFRIVYRPLLKILSQYSFYLALPEYQ
jgi:hypothetical protein